MSLVEKQCLQCNKVFRVSSYYVKVGKYNCCSHKCASLFKKGKQLSETAKLNMSKAQRGRKVTWGEKIGKALKGRKTGKSAWNKGLFGIIKHPENSGKNNTNWKGGKYYHNGYVLKLCKGHARQNNKGYVPEHILVAEKCLKRCVTKTEIIHHINGNKSDNRPKNLYLFSSKSEHHKLHQNPLLKNVKLTSNLGT